MENDRDILLIAILTFITVFSWIFFDLIKTSQTSTISESTEQLLTPLTPTIDTETLNKLSLRINYK
jgi:hypothetical protein